MANIAKKAILRAKLEGVLTDLMVKTTAEQVYIDDTTTLAAKLAEILADVALKANTEDMNTAITDAVDGLRQEMLGDVPVEAYNTFTELAAYISEHQEAADALTAAIGEKADKSTVEALQATVEALGALANKDTVSEADLDAELAEKINTASAGNHAHENKAVLDGITAELVESWNSKSNSLFYASATEPEAMTEGDLWAQIIE